MCQAESDLSFHAPLLLDDGIRNKVELKRHLKIAGYPACTPMEKRKYTTGMNPSQQNAIAHQGMVLSARHGFTGPV